MASRDSGAYHLLREFTERPDADEVDRGDRHEEEGGGDTVRDVREPVGDELADHSELDHRDEGDDLRVMHHTGVRPAFEGQGLAARLVRRALDDARADGVQVVPTCWYVAGYLDRHPDDADLRAPRT